VGGLGSTERSRSVLPALLSMAIEAMINEARRYS
jgi:hypothetical protein